MGLTSREPSTKFFGPNYPFVIPPAASRVHVQLWHLEHGDLWNPAFESELLGKKILLPVANPPRWDLYTTHFEWHWHYRQHRYVSGIRTKDHRVELTVRYWNGARPILFQHKPNFLCTSWMANLIQDPAETFAYGGFATLAWKDVF